jgi:hypothetical protein
MIGSTPIVLSGRSKHKAARETTWAYGSTFPKMNLNGIHQYLDSHRETLEILPDVVNPNTLQEHETVEYTRLISN